MSAAKAATGAATAMAPAASRARNGARSSFTCFLHPFGRMQSTAGANLRPPQGRLLGCYFRMLASNAGNTGRGAGRASLVVSPRSETEVELVASYAADVIVLCDHDDREMTADGI